MSISIQSRKGQILPGQNLYISIGKRRSSIPINPDIINYIQNVQNDKDKDKLRQSEQKKNSSQNKYEQIVTRKIKGQSQNLVFKEDMTTDKDKRFNAKKGLLFLLNNLSKGTFCPDIEEYFKKMKEKKVEEFKNKINDDINNFNIIDELDKKERKKKGRDSSIKKLINTLAENEINNIEFNNKINYNFKKKENNKDIKEPIGIKKYEDDYDEDDLINLYDKKELKDNLFHINYNKKKLYKMKLLQENMKNSNKNNEN
jgi:hypothetical protein